MADDKLREEIAQMDQTMFGEGPALEASPQPAPQVEGENPSLDELFVAAGLETPPASEAQPASETPAQDAKPADEGLAAGEEPSQQDIMHAYMQQQAQLNEQLATQQQQTQQVLSAQQQQAAQQQQQAAQPNMNDPRELAEMMTTVGLDPTSATDVYMFRSDMERRQQQGHYQDQIEQMQGYINTMHGQQQQAKHAASLGPQIDATLRVYGEIPPEVAGNIKAQASTILSENLGNATEAQAIQWAMEPYLPLFKMIQQGAVPQAQTQAAPQQHHAVQPNANAQAVLAAALSGGSSGHGPSLEDMTIDQFEKALFRNN